MEVVLNSLNIKNSPMVMAGVGFYLPDSEIVKNQRFEARLSALIALRTQWAWTVYVPGCYWLSALRGSAHRTVSIACRFACMSNPPSPSPNPLWRNMLDESIIFILEAKYHIICMAHIRGYLNFFNKNKLMNSNNAVIPLIMIINHLIMYFRYTHSVCFKF